MITNSEQRGDPVFFHRLTAAARCQFAMQEVTLMIHYTTSVSRNGCLFVDELVVC